jgi:hypothetical protein
MKAIAYYKLIVFQWLKISTYIVYNSNFFHLL